MKKSLLILVGAILATLFFFICCVYVGLPAEKVKRHNEVIKQQLPGFSLDNFNGSFYYIPGSEGKSISFSSKNGKREYLIKTNEKLSYFDGNSEKTYTFSLKSEVNTSGNTVDYQAVDNDIQDILNVVQSYDGTYDKIKSISGSQKYGEEIYDEIEHNVYSMEWKYSSIAVLIFYLNANTSALHSIYLRDVSEDMNEEKAHFDLFIYPNESFVSSLEDEYETLKSVA